MPQTANIAILHEQINSWYTEAARNLPWRIPPEQWPWPDVDRPWAILVSEVMLQQTPVARVEPIWHEWIRRWPTPANLAVASPGEAVREWKRLGYPRRALRLHAAASTVVTDHAGIIPSDFQQLQALPGIGIYTAAAVEAFAFGIRSVVIDTNVRRVQARLVTGVAQAAPRLTTAETQLANSMLPADEVTTAVWNVAVMELGALICTVSAPACDRCPVRDRCVWVHAGRPTYDGPVKRVQKWAGTDRQVRGKLLQVLRDAHAPVSRHYLDMVWHDTAQRNRCLTSLIEDGLIEIVDVEKFRLPN